MKLTGLHRRRRSRNRRCFRGVRETNPSAYTSPRDGRSSQFFSQAPALTRPISYGGTPSRSELRKLNLLRWRLLVFFPCFAKLANLGYRVGRCLFSLCVSRSSRAQAITLEVCLLCVFREARQQKPIALEVICFHSAFREARKLELLECLRKHVFKNVLAFRIKN